MRPPTASTPPGSVPRPGDPEGTPTPAVAWWPCPGPRPGSRTWPSGSPADGAAAATTIAKSRSPRQIVTGAAHATTTARSRAGFTSSVCRRGLSAGSPVRCMSLRRNAPECGPSPGAFRLRSCTLHAARFIQVIQREQRLAHIASMGLIAAGHIVRGDAIIACRQQAERDRLHELLAGSRFPQRRQADILMRRDQEAGTRAARRVTRSAHSCLPRASRSPGRRTKPPHTTRPRRSIRTPKSKSRARFPRSSG